jgi:hypothetical protein
MSQMSTFDFTNVVNADTILQPSDFKEGLQVHRGILSIASPVFADMFTLPQSVDNGATESVTRLPRVVLTEARSIIEALLCFIYPVPNPAVRSLHDLVPLLDAARKYEIAIVMVELRKHLISPQLLTPESSLRVYAIADRFDLEDERQAASRASLSVDLLNAPLSDDLKHITGYAYHRLLVLHRRRAQSAVALVKGKTVPNAGRCNNYNYCNGNSWWPDYVRRAEEELSKRSTADVFTEEFVSKSSGCGSCQMRTLPFIRTLKAEVDALPCIV